MNKLIVLLAIVPVFAFAQTETDQKVSALEQEVIAIKGKSQGLPADVAQNTADIQVLSEEVGGLADQVNQNTADIAALEMGSGGQRTPYTVDANGLVIGDGENYGGDPLFETPFGLVQVPVRFSTTNSDELYPRSYTLFFLQPDCEGVPYVRFARVAYNGIPIGQVIDGFVIIPDPSLSAEAHIPVSALGKLSSQGCQGLEDEDPRAIDLIPMIEVLQLPAFVPPFRAELR